MFAVLGLAITSVKIANTRLHFFAVAQAASRSLSNKHRYEMSGLCRVAVEAARMAE